MDQTILIAAAAGLIIALTVILHRPRHEEKPVKGTILDRVEGTIRLRDIFRLAVSIEEEGSVFYRLLAERTGDPAVKTLCRRLANEELAHKAVFEKQLGQWRDLPEHHALQSVLLEEIRRKGILAAPPGPDASEDEMAAYAIDQEIKTIEFYQAFEKAFPLAWKRARMHELVTEERGHESSLRRTYPLK